MDDYLDIVRSVKPKPNARRSYQPLNSQHQVSEIFNIPQRASVNPAVPNPSRPTTTLINNIPKQGFDQIPVTYSVPYSVSPQNIAPSSINYLHEGFPAITTTTSQFIPRSTQAFYQSSYNNLAPPVSEMRASNFNQFSQINQRSRVSPQQESRRKTSLRENDRKEREDRKSVKKLKKRKRNFKRNMLFLGGIVLLVIIAILGFKYLNSEENSVVFCDNGDFGNCESCPPKGVCKEGKLESCEEGREIYKNECLSRERLEARKKIDQYINFIDNRLTQLKGDRECYYSLRPYMTKQQIGEELSKEFKDDNLIQNNMTLILSHIERSVEQGEHPHLYKHEEEDRYHTNRTGESSAFCRMKLVWMNEKSRRVAFLIIFWILLLVSSVEYGRRYILKKREYKRLAGELYIEILAYLSHWDKVRVKQLKKDFEEWAQDYNYRRLWNYVEDLKKKDCKIYSYLDYFQNNVEEFWALPK